MGPLPSPWSIPDRRSFRRYDASAPRHCSAAPDRRSRQDARRGPRPPDSTVSTAPVVGMTANRPWRGPVDEVRPAQRPNLQRLSQLVAVQGAVPGARDVPTARHGATAMLDDESARTTGQCIRIPRSGPTQRHPAAILARPETRWAGCRSAPRIRLRAWPSPVAPPALGEAANVLAELADFAAQGRVEDKRDHNVQGN